jgi:hypothetical protein
MVLNTEGSQAITVSGWTEAPSSPATTGAEVRLTVFYKIAVGSDATTTSDSGQRQVGRIIGITTGTFNATTPFNTSGTNLQDTNVTAVSITGVTTTAANCLILAISASDVPDLDGTDVEFSSAANASLSNVTEIIDDRSSAGAGAAMCVISGGLATAGASGTTTVTAANAGRRANITLAINQAPQGDSVGMIPIF